MLVGDLVQVELGQDASHVRPDGLHVDDQVPATDACRGAGAISRIETGQRRLAVDQLVTLARALGISVDDLLADDDVIARSPAATAGRCSC